MDDKGFIFDYSKCVGCQACMVACYNENCTQLPILWRQVQPFNRLKVPLSGFISVSIACNHCIDAPCVKACPAQAYKKDSTTGAIIHSPEKCIGCTYCTWACPFDAPKYNKLKGVVEKCNFCNDRLTENIAPACANACPTGALSFGDIIISEKSLAPGMSSKPTKPRANFKNYGTILSAPKIDIAVTGYGLENLKNASSNEKSKINAAKEWPLVFFTLISAFLVGWITALLLGLKHTEYRFCFAVLGALAMALSTLHLGKPFRAYRAICNLKTSWLSKEILLFTIFLCVSLFTLFIYESLILYVVACVVGILLLVSVELVYSVTDKNYTTPIHSANTVLTALTFGFMLSNIHSVAVGLIALKAILYIVRYAGRDIRLRNALASFARFFIGIMVPLVGLMLLNDNLGVIVPFLLGELIDRFEYYSDLRVETPGNLLNKYNQNKDVACDNSKTPYSV